MKNLRVLLWQERVNIALLILPFLAGVLWWGHLPEQIPMHWNVKGQIDSYSSKLVGVLFLPLLAIGMWALLVATPVWASKQGNEQLRSSTWRIIRFATTLLLCIVQFAILFTALGHHVDMIMVVYYVVVFFFILIGNIIGTVQPNYLVGVRTPWTLNNEEVWRKTHRFTGRLWVAAGVLFFVVGTSLQSGNYSTPLIIFVVLTGSIPLVYSYIISRRPKA